MSMTCAGSSSATSCTAQAPAAVVQRAPAIDERLETYGGEAADVRVKDCHVVVLHGDAVRPILKTETTMKLRGKRDWREGKSLYLHHVGNRRRKHRVYR